jgi:ferritin
MLSKKVEDILNIQVDKEGYSSHLYLAMAVWAETGGLGGIADWLYAQAEEERMHMLKLVRYINERDGKAKIIAVKEPPAEFGHTTHNWIQWFVTEQIEEEASVKALIDKLKLVGDHHMYIFDRDIMGMRGSGEATAE